jgi:16S rRNA (cytidine1402-2'-O)-methyltransferase
MKSAGTLYLVPVSLADPKGADQATLVEGTLPPATRMVAAGLRLVAAENAKAARAFFKASGAAVPIQEIEIVEIGHAPLAADLAPLVNALLQGRDVGLLSEAGCPAVADPGAALVALAHQAEIRVVPLVGPSALLLALMASGLEGQRFAFVGYLPVKPAERAQAIRTCEARSRNQRETQIAIETPYRNHALYEALLAGLQPATRLTVALDLTLAAESVVTRTVAQWRKGTAPALDKRQAVFLFLAA